MCLIKIRSLEEGAVPNGDSSSPFEVIVPPFVVPLLLLHFVLDVAHVFLWTILFEFPTQLRCFSVRMWTGH